MTEGPRLSRPNKSDGICASDKGSGSGSDDTAVAVADAGSAPPRGLRHRVVPVWPGCGAVV
jgi:hypothetical protein